MNVIMKSLEIGSSSPETAGRKFYRLTPKQFNSLPDGTSLHRWALSDHPEGVVIKGKDKISMDTRDGFMALGLFEEDIPEGLEVDEYGMEIEGKKIDDKE